MHFIATLYKKKKGGVGIFLKKKEMGTPIQNWVEVTDTD